MKKILQYQFNLMILLFLTGFNVSLQGQCNPENDDPFIDSPRPPFILTGGGSHSGTTCCAIGYADDPTMDYPNKGCSVATHENAVWYIYHVTNEKHLSILVEETGPNNITGFTTIEVYEGSSTIPGGLLNSQSYDCSSLPSKIKFGCLMPGQVVWVKVASRDANCGTFLITTEEFEVCEYADRCSDLSAAQTINTVNGECQEFTVVTHDGCFEYACPEEGLTDCGFNENPTVWYKINVDSNATVLFVVIPIIDNFLIWGIYGGDCDSLVLLSDIINSFDVLPCNFDSATPEVYGVCVPRDEHGNAVKSVYIALRSENPFDNPNFTISAFTLSGSALCLGFDCGQNNSKIEILERSSHRELDDLSFCQGEEVSVCLQYDYFRGFPYTDDLLHGLIPDFGNGWDMEFFDPMDITISPSGSEYLGHENGACAPITTKDLPGFCTYVDDFGVLRVCNTLSQTCPCVGPLENGSLLPFGWFWNTEGDAECENDCNPSTNYGLPDFMFYEGSSVRICMKLRTKVFDNLADCSGQNDLQIKFMVTTDEVSGCRNTPNPAFIQEKVQYGPLWKIECAPYPVIEVGADTICDNGILEIHFTTSDESETLITVTPIPNPNILGAKSYTFENGLGTVLDTIKNLTNETQIIQYVVGIENDGEFCTSKEDTIFILLFGKIEVDFSLEYQCDIECINIMPLIVSEYPINEYLWSNGDLIENILVCPAGLEVYSLTITNNQGCTASGSLPIEPKPDLSFDILPDSVFIFQDSTAVNIEVELVNIITNGINYTIEWEVPQGLDGATIDSTNKFVIYHQTSISRKNPYSLCATIINEEGCTATKCIPVHISRPLDSILCTSWIVDAALEFQSDSLYNCTDYGYFEIRRSIFEGVEYIVFYGYNGSFGLANNWEGRTYTLDGVLIHAFDSEVNNGACNPCQELAFEVENNIYHCQEEYPMCCNLEISGYVFSDNVEMPNGMFDPGENPIGLIEIELWTVSGHGCPGSLDTLVALYTTDGTGEYIFTGLRPDTYRVRIAPSMFDLGGPLNKYSASTFIDYCVVLECDSYPGIDTFYFGFYFDCGGGPILHYENCQLASESPVICNLAILDLYCNEMFTQNSPGPVPNPLCPNGGTPYNMSWFAFVAGNGTYDIVLRPYDCLMGGGEIGIQAGIYKDCSFSEAVYCLTECTTGSISLPSSSLVPGETYYFFLNGCGGSVCSYEIDITGNYSPYVLPLPTGIKIGEGVCSLICPEQEVQITLEGLSTGIEYTWSIIDSSGTVPADMTFFPGWPVTTENSVTLAFPRVGVYTLCMETVRSHCDTLIGPYCVDVEVVTSTEEIFQYEVCTIDFPWDGSFDASGEFILDIYGNPIKWSEGSITLEIIQDGITQFESEYINDCGCLYIQQIQITEPEVGLPCDDGDPETINDVIQDDCSCKGEIEVSIKDHNSSNKFSIFPNPSTGIIIVKGKDLDKSLHEIYNVDGQLKKYEFKDSGLELELDLSGLVPGIYFLKIDDGMKIHFAKIIKI